MSAHEQPNLVNLNTYGHSIYIIILCGAERIYDKYTCIRVKVAATSLSVHSTVFRDFYAIYLGSL